MSKIEAVKELVTKVWEDGYDSRRNSSREFKEGKLPIERIREYSRQIVQALKPKIHAVSGGGSPMYSGLTCSKCGETFASEGYIPELCPKCQQEQGTIDIGHPLVDRPSDELISDEEKLPLLGEGYIKHKFYEDNDFKHLSPKAKAGIRDMFYDFATFFNWIALTQRDLDITFYSLGYKSPEEVKELVKAIRYLQDAVDKEAMEKQKIKEDYQKRIEQVFEELDKFATQLISQGFVDAEYKEFILNRVKALKAKEVSNG